MLRYYRILSLFWSLALMGSTLEKPRVLALIIASDNQPIYLELQQLWRQYMHLDPAHVTAYFIKGDPTLAAEHQIIGDTIWSQTVENPYPGILNKTVKSLIALQSRLPEFDYILRADLSSLYIWPRLLDFLQTCPRQRFYGGYGDIGANMGSGCGFLLSTDVGQLMIDQRAQLFQQADAGPDDCVIANFLSAQGIQLQCHERCDWVEGNRYYFRRTCQGSALPTMGALPASAFHLRIKNNRSDLRLTEDLALYRKFLTQYYALS